MKLPSHLPVRRRRAPLLCTFFMLSLLGAGCSGPDAELGQSAAPATPGSASAPGGGVRGAGSPAEPEPDVVVFGSAGDDNAVANPPEEPKPTGTETNFLTPPCGADDSRLAADAGVADAGAPSGPGAPPGVADAGNASDSVPAGSPPSTDGARMPCPNQP